ncbi:MAG TPA: OmpA family protein [Leptolyngbyaceae cyanobacterium]
MKNLIKLFYLAVASSLLLAGAAYWIIRNKSPKTTIEAIPVPVSTLEIQPVATTSLEISNQPTSSTTQIETEPATTTTTEIETEATTSTTITENKPNTTEIETEPTPSPTTKLEVENQPVSPTKVEVETPPPTKITSATVERTLTELKAEKITEGIRINLPENILFDFDKYYVRAQAKPTLNKLNQLVTYYSKSTILIHGHTDSKGDDAYNQKLSQLRAAAVKYYLINVFKVPPNRLQTQGFGKTKPIAPNNNTDGSDNPPGRQKNRRVEVIIKT